MAGGDHPDRRHPRVADRHVCGHGRGRESRSTRCRCLASCWPSASSSTTPSSSSRTSSAICARACRRGKPRTRPWTKSAARWSPSRSCSSRVFLPTAFIAGLQGSFYRQFAITIAAATAISAFVSLTLSPALAALLLKPHDEQRDPEMGGSRPSSRAAALVLRRLQLGVRALVARLWRDDRAARAARRDHAGRLRRAALSHLLPPDRDADRPHSAARPHLFHRGIPAAAGIDAQSHRRGRAQGGRYPAVASGRRGGGRLRRLRRRDVHQRAQHRRHFRPPEVVRGARASEA